VFLQALSKKASCSFVPVPEGVCGPVRSGVLGAGLCVPSRVHWSEFPTDREMCDFTMGVKRCKVFVLAQVLLDLWEGSLKRMEVLRGDGRRRGRGFEALK